MFFLNLFIAPAIWAVELSNEGFGFLDAYLINTVFVTVKLKNASVTLIAHTLNRIHHVNGLWHEDGLNNVWAVMVLIVSVLLLGLGVTGLWLWFRIHEERVIGGVIFAAGLVVGLGLVIAMRMQA